MPKTLQFKKLSLGVKKQYLGKPVPFKFRVRYGKRYGIKDVRSLSYAIAKSKGIRIDRK